MMPKQYMCGEGGQNHRSLSQPFISTTPMVFHGVLPSQRDCPHDTQKPVCKSIMGDWDSLRSFGNQLLNGNVTES